MNDNLKGDTLLPNSDDEESKPVGSGSKKRIWEQLQKSATSVDQLLEFMKTSQARVAKKEDLEFYLKCLRELRDPNLSAEERTFYHAQMKNIEETHKLDHSSDGSSM